MPAVSSKDQLVALIRLADAHFLPRSRITAEFDNSLDQMSTEAVIAHYKMRVKARWVEDIHGTISDAQPTNVDAMMGQEARLEIHKSVGLNAQIYEIQDATNMDVDQGDNPAEEDDSDGDDTKYYIPNIGELTDEPPDIQDLNHKSKVVVQILRHRLDVVEHDQRGYVKIRALLKNSVVKFSGITVQDLFWMERNSINNEDKPRYGFNAARDAMRAIQGHTTGELQYENLHERLTLENVAFKLNNTDSDFASARYVVHGTNKRTIPSILVLGLISGGTKAQNAKHEVFCARAQSFSNRALKYNNTPAGPEFIKGEIALIINLHKVLTLQQHDVYMTQAWSVLIIANKDDPLPPEFIVGGYRNTPVAINSANITIDRSVENWAEKFFSDIASSEEEAKFLHDTYVALKKLQSEGASSDDILNKSLKLTDVHYAKGPASGSNKRGRSTGAGARPKGGSDNPPARATGGVAKKGDVRYRTNHCSLFHPDPAANWCPYGKNCAFIHERPGTEARKFQQTGTMTAALNKAADRWAEREAAGGHDLHPGGAASSSTGPTAPPGIDNATVYYAGRPQYRNPTGKGAASQPLSKGSAAHR